MDATVTLGEQGRLVIPSGVRAELGLAPGDRLHLEVRDHRIVLERPEDARRALRGVLSHVPAQRSLVDELIAERRAERRAENRAESTVERRAEPR